MSITHTKAMRTEYDGRPRTTAFSLDVRVICVPMDRGRLQSRGHKVVHD